MPDEQKQTTEDELRAVTIEEIERMLAFRDRLRSDEAERELYARAKRELAGRRWEDVQNYTDAKTQVVEEILARALPGDPGIGVKPPGP